jgi:hypothetical protein
MGAKEMNNLAKMSAIWQGGVNEFFRFMTFMTRQRIASSGII